MERKILDINVNKSVEMEDYLHYNVMMETMKIWMDALQIVE
jgi:hypothetical protein